jgi:hypothetical protein
MILSRGRKNEADRGVGKRKRFIVEEWRVFHPPKIIEKRGRSGSAFAALARFCQACLGRGDLAAD